MAVPLHNLPLIARRPCEELIGADTQHGSGIDRIQYMIFPDESSGIFLFYFFIIYSKYKPVRK
jgi:hypothetical protein